VSWLARPFPSWARRAVPDERAAGGGHLLAGLLRTSRLTLLGAWGSGVVGGLGGVLLLAIVNRALTSTAAARASLAASFAAVAAVMLLARWISQRYFVRLGQQTLARLRLELASRWAQAPLADLEKAGTGRLLSSLVEDADAISTFFAWMPNLLMQAVVVLGCLASLAWLSLPVFLLACAGLVLGSLAQYVAMRRASLVLARARQEEERLYGHFNGLFAGAKELALHRPRRDAFLGHIVGGSVERARRLLTTSEYWNVAAIHGGMLAFHAVVAAVVFPLSSELQLPAATRAGCAAILLYLMAPIHAVLESVALLPRVRLAGQRISSTRLAGPDGATDAPALRSLAEPAPFRSVELRGVCHRHSSSAGDASFSLGPLDLTLRAGEIVFLVGGNGSGKTTLAKLLVGLYEPAAGDLFLDGRRLAGDDMEDYRQHFSAVFSDYHVFERLHGLDPTQLDARARTWLRALGLDHKVRVDGGALSTTQLSSGQRKRLALLIAALENRPVCCFDEWAADQDPAHKRLFYMEVLPELARQGRAVLVITHDERYFHVAARCFRLENGRVRWLSDGSSAEALRQGVG
jgi:putative pyoverdin transport system ATP-binding/permease protein